MRESVILLCVLVAAVAQGDVSAVENGRSAEARDARRTEASTPGVSAAPVAYVPPASIGAPRDRTVGAATRSARLPAPTLYSLVPEHTGQTVSAQPSLLWFVDSLPSEDTPVYFTLVNEKQIDPIAEIRLPRVSSAGIQRVDLAAYGITLERGTEYEWTVALVLDPDRRSDDLVTAGWVMVVDEPAGLEPTARSYAANGLWYDAIAAAPDDLRADLLREVGLGGVLDTPAPD